MERRIFLGQVTAETTQPVDSRDESLPPDAL